VWRRMTAGAGAEHWGRVGEEDAGGLCGGERSAGISGGGQRRDRVLVTPAGGDWARSTSWAAPGEKSRWRFLRSDRLRVPRDEGSRVSRSTFSAIIRDEAGPTDPLDLRGYMDEVLLRGGG